MEVRYRLDGEDFFHVQNYLSRQCLNESVLRYLPAIGGFVLGSGCVIAVLLLLEFYDEYSYLDLTLLSWGIGLFLGSGLAYYLTIAYSNKAFRKLIFLDGRAGKAINRIVLESEYISTSCKGFEAKISYDEIYKVTEDEKFSYFFFDNILALVIPHTAFENADSKNRFIDTTRIKMGEHLS